ncbi:unnamed protein product [Polarella glacialis]|uniref:Transmembrane protein n=1 Tax=Polarella glacialis TaxID=89957 RepID=A0A813DLZ0_POLGL|nr:unnamed protein product [Polarella glacialis]
MQASSRFSTTLSMFKVPLCLLTLAAIGDAVEEAPPSELEDLCANMLAAEGFTTTTTTTSLQRPLNASELLLAELEIKVREAMREDGIAAGKVAQDMINFKLILCFVLFTISATLVSFICFRCSRKARRVLSNLDRFLRSLTVIALTMSTLLLSLGLSAFFALRALDNIQAATKDVNEYFLTSFLSTLTHDWIVAAKTLGIQTQLGSPSTARAGCATPLMAS